MPGESQEKKRRWTILEWPDGTWEVRGSQALLKRVEVMPVSEHIQILKGLVEELDEERLRLRGEERIAAKRGKRAHAMVFEREANGIERALGILHSHLEGEEDQ